MIWQLLRAAAGSHAILVPVQQRMPAFPRTHTRMHGCVRAQTSADMGRLADQGVNSFKFFMAYKVGAPAAPMRAWSTPYCISILRD